MQVRSTVTINRQRLRQITQASITALEQTAEALHTEVVQAQVIPRMDGHLQGEKFYVDTSKSAQGKIRLVHEGPYASSSGSNTYEFITQIDGKVLFEKIIEENNKYKKRHN